MERQFALRWIAYEGLVRRTAIKALWMRGAMVREAQKTINQLQGPEWENPTLLLGNCGTYISIPLFKTLQESPSSFSSIGCCDKKRPFQAYD